VKHFDASTPPDAVPDVAQELAGLRTERAEQDLLDSLDRLENVLAELDEAEADEELDPELVALLEEITGAEDAPLTFRSLHDRVHHGFLTWADYWADPAAEADGLLVFRAVVQAQLTSMAAIRAERPPAD
jgi:hypothetical protein